MSSLWRTFHGDGKEILINVLSISVLTEIEDGGTLITLKNGIHMRVDEDITEVKAEMFI